MDAIVENAPHIECFHCTNNEDAVLLLRQEVHKGDIVLVKGSRGVKLDLVVDSLMRVYCSEKCVAV
jgi:UDP-N-acetylmuramyl pentapeptide synthase